MKEDLKYETESMRTSNDASIYIWLSVGVVIGLFGAFFRFVHDSFTISLISWIFLFIGTAIAISNVFKILKA